MVLFPPTPPSPPPKPKPLEWCGIKLESAIVYPTSLALLAPAESAHLFNGRKHARWYRKLVDALDRKKEMVEVWVKEDSQAEKIRRTDLRRGESDMFHEEFLQILEWGKPSCILASSAQELETIKQRFSSENWTSNFPTINLFLEKYPNRTITWAVDHFYRWQQGRYVVAEELTKIKHLWEWYETCYTFQCVVQALRREHAASWESWFYCLRQKMERMPDEQCRKRNQFQRLKEIWQHCIDNQIEFPVDICPGGMTPMEYFQLAGGGGAAALLGRSRSRVISPQMLDEIAVMMAYETPEEYYTAVGEWPLDFDDPDFIFDDHSDTASVDFDEGIPGKPGNAESLVMPGTYPSSHFVGGPE
ncbi:hypothetical protein BZA05DRAFT_463628 [Tricharina praecox]|uniref:uncharacterized protein n=1 Tax=Tricharina praecox TaxID=43433 RepID=UPI002220F5A3|nr:uncharacterized protein BZA05DRAFT_463628 [Tricharina praecox]KAI5856430.1 hypothetical protein BZA05DRAFT_463628 [Tricharina praecox]